MAARFGPAGIAALTVAVLGYLGYRFIFDTIEDSSDIINTVRRSNEEQIAASQQNQQLEGNNRTLTTLQDLGVLGGRQEELTITQISVLRELSSLVNFNRELANRLADLRPKVDEILNKFGYDVVLDLDFQGIVYNLSLIHISEPTRPY